MPVWDDVENQVDVVDAHNGKSTELGVVPFLDHGRRNANSLSGSWISPSFLFGVVEILCHLVRRETMFL